MTVTVRYTNFCLLVCSLRARRSRYWLPNYKTWPFTLRNIRKERSKIGGWGGYLSPRRRKYIQ